MPDALTSTAALHPDQLMPDQLPSVLGWMVRAFQGGDWMVGAGLVLMLLVAMFRILGLSRLVDKRHTKYVAAMLALLTSASAGMLAHASWWSILSTALGVALSAIGGWEILAKPIIGFVQRLLGGKERLSQ